MERLGKILLMAIPTLILAGIVFAGKDDAPVGIGKARVQEIGALADDTAPDSVDEGDVGVPRMSLNRNLHVELQDGAGNERAANVNASYELLTNNASVLVDDAAFTATTSDVDVCGFVFDDTSPDSVDEGDAGAVRMSANRNLYSTIRDAAGNERGVNVTASNELNVLDSNTGSIKTAVELIDNPVLVDDAAFTPATSSVYMAGAEFDDASPDSVDEGDAGALRMSANRSLHIEVQDGSGNERALDINADGAAEVVQAPLVWDSDNTGNCASITASSAQLTLDTDSDHFRCCAWGNSAYALTGSNPTATTTAGSGFSFIMADGQCHELTTADAKIAVIGTSAAGSYCCISLEAP